MLSKRYVSSFFSYLSELSGSGVVIIVNRKALLALDSGVSRVRWQWKLTALTAQMCLCWASLLLLSLVICITEFVRVF